jgi:hypothetical protein
VASPKLRIGLLVDSCIQPSWVYKVIKDIRDSGYAEIVLTVKNRAKSLHKGRSALRTVLENRRHILRKLYTEIDRRLFASDPDPFEPVDITSLLGSAPTLEITPRQTRYSDYFSQEDVNVILGHQLDVGFRFGFRILKGDALSVARFGIWSYHHGDNLVRRGGPAGFWEVMEGHPVTGSILQILTPRLDDGKVIYRSWASTVWFSVQRNRKNCYWKSAEFAARKLRDLFEQGPSALEDSSHLYRPYSHRLQKAPGNLEMLSLLVVLWRKMARRGLDRLFYREQWFVAYETDVGNEMSDSFHRFKTMMPPTDRYWADPFPVERDGRYFIFIEELEFKAVKAHLSVIEMDQNGRWQKPVKILERPYHLSHPFVFEWLDQYYMIPETRENRTLELYRCVSFPFEWELDRVLMKDLVAVDATLAQINDRWWLFVNIAVDGASTNDELHVFYSGSPLGPWHSHRGNPVKSDVRSSRPAGKLFYWRGALYRPAQDSSVAYGHAISINKIERLSVDEFAEVEVSRIVPEWRANLTRNHTVNHASGLTVIDGLRRVRRWF